MTPNQATDSTKPETAEREEMIRKLNAAADILRDDVFRQAAALLEDGKAGGEVRLDICAGYVHQSCLDEAAATGNAVDVQIMSEPFPGGVAIFTRPQQAAQVAQPLTETQVIGLMNDHLHYNGALSAAWDMPVYACTVEHVRSLLAAAHGIGKDQP